MTKKKILAFTPKTPVAPKPTAKKASGKPGKKSKPKKLKGKPLMLRRYKHHLDTTKVLLIARLKSIPIMLVQQHKYTEG